MATFLSMACEGPFPERWMTTPAGIPLPRNCDGTYQIGFPSDSSEWYRLLDFLEEERRSPRSFGFSLMDFPSKEHDERNWTNPDESWVGAIPLWDDNVEASPANTFHPVFPPPCFGVVPPGVPIHVCRRPRDHVVGVGKDIVFSEAVCGFFASLLIPCEFDDVVFKGKVLRSHRRLLPKQSRKIIAAEGLDEVRCAWCHSPRLIGIGSCLYLGRRVSDLVVCRDEQGVGDLGAEHEYVFSVAVAQELSRRFRKGFGRGYGLEPILDIDSPEGQRILHLFCRLQKLKRTGGTPGIALASDS
jgi:hypothetical protein